MSNLSCSVLLAGGDGTRLLPLTRRICGDDRAKQFCPIFGSKTLLALTRDRTARLFPPERTFFSVVESQRRFYEAELADVMPSRIFVQPANRGTTAAIIYSLLQITRRNPDAIVAFFPTDHHYAHEDAFGGAVELACETVRHHPEFLLLMGATPEWADSDYGWIEPGACVGSAQSNSVFHVNRFWEKPSRSVADELHKNGCLLNTFVMVARAGTFMALLQSAVPDIVRAFEPLAAQSSLEMKITRRIYNRLPQSDFSHQVLAACADRLLVLRLADAGWSDLGTEERVSAVMARQGLVKAAGHSYAAGPEPHSLEAFHVWLAAYRQRLNEVCKASAAPDATRTHN